LFAVGAAPLIICMPGSSCPRIALSQAHHGQLTNTKV
jgi:hypothetical protein